MERRACAVDSAEWPTRSGELLALEAQVVPLVDAGQGLLGAAVTFADVTRSRRFQEELEQANRGLEDAYAELQSTNEELETTNEELSTRTTELNQVNAFLESIWESLGGAVIVLDAELRVLVWTRRSEDLWGLRPQEALGVHLLNLDMGLPVDHLRPALRAALAGEDGIRSQVVKATNRRGRPIDCRVTCSPLWGSQREIRGVIVLGEELAAGA